MKVAIFPIVLATLLGGCEQASSSSGNVYIGARPASDSFCLRPSEARRIDLAGEAADLESLRALSMHYGVCEADMAAYERLLRLRVAKGDEDARRELLIVLPTEDPAKAANLGGPRELKPHP